MPTYQASYVFPVASPPIENGFVRTDENGVIRSVRQTKPDDIKRKDIQVLKGVLCPGFVNTHCHLELSHLKKQIPRNTGLPKFIQKVVELRHITEEPEIKRAITEAENLLLEQGTVAVGDISNTGHTLSLKQKGHLHYHTFLELTGIAPAAADEAFEKGLRMYQDITETERHTRSITPHAPYSVSPELLKKISTFATHNGRILSMHIAECEAENKFLREKEGPMVDVFEALGIDLSFFEPVNTSGIRQVIQHLDENVRLLSVHNTYLKPRQIDWACDHHNDIYWCLCPNANRYIENQLPPIAVFHEKDLPVCIGTDSLASNKHLSILEELKTIQQHHPDITLEKLLEWGTLNGARALNFDDRLGSLERGKRPGLNLLTGVNVEKGQFTEKSRVTPIET